MIGSVVIDYFPDSVRHYQDGYAIVAIDVIRATTTAITAVAAGRRCFPVPSIEFALPLAAKLDHPLLVGELGGNMPYGFDLTNSPAEIAHRSDTFRAMILLSTSGTPLIYNARTCDAVYLACFRNYDATAKHLIGRHHRVAVIGAGSRNEFRREDQLCCSWIAKELINAGYEPEDSTTVEIVNRWSDASPEVCKDGKSAQYLIKTNQIRDLDFILKHLNDLKIVVMLKHDELTAVQVMD